MKLIITTITVLLVAVRLQQRTHPGSSLPPTLVNGKVISAANGAPLADAYVFTQSGEEEGITDKRGIFNFKTWQQLPVACTVQHKNYSQQIIQITDTKPITIKLINN